MSNDISFHFISYILVYKSAEIQKKLFSVSATQKQKV